MKKVLLALIVIVLPGFILQSCKKICEHNDETPSLQTVDATLDKNTTYTYVLPANTSDDNFQITSNPTHAGYSQIVVDGATGNLVYQYTPLIDYTGTDQLVIATAEEQHGHGNCIHPTNGKLNPNGSACQGSHHGDKSYIITFNLNIDAGNSIKASKTAHTSSTSSSSVY